MFRLLGRQTFNALRSPLRLPSSRHLHTLQIPPSGPPTYDALARRLSSYPNPVNYFVHKRQLEARDRGEFIDIHDIAGIDPRDFDVLITDISDAKLRSEVAEVLGIQYLMKASEAEANKLVEIGHGIIYGRTLRTIFPCVVSYEDKAHWVFFIVDTGAPMTYLSAQTSKLLGISEDRTAFANVAGYRHPVNMSPKDSHFVDINLLGMDFYSACNINMWYDYKNSKAELYFGRKWGRPIMESKL